ncbi:hypothetical protein SDC9_67091 [bioreactor metagenome]|uniref:Uncharacterized protein n=1 Tax=bioreactor metagenome TaxID=1076179 RepID=A0A644XWU3_9ZZZZ
MHRPTPAFFGAFRLVNLAPSQQGGVCREENHSKNARCRVRAVLAVRIFEGASNNHVANTDARGFPMPRRKSTRENRCRESSRHLSNSRSISAKVMAR